MKQLYKDEIFELNTDVEGVNGVELKINGNQYILTSDYHEPCTYIQTTDGTVNIVMHNAFDMSTVVNKFEKGQNTNTYHYRDVSPKRFCKIMESEILKDRSEKKQQIVQENGYKTATK